MMSAFKDSLENYALVPASEAQDLVATQREWVEWGHPLLTQDQFITREKDVLGTSDFSVTRRRRWVLVPADDTHTLDFLAGCETYRRPILVRRGGGEVQRALSYSVCSVFVPEDKRRHGYAAKMMTLLQHHLNPAGCVPPPLDQGSIHDSHSLTVPLDDPSSELSDDGAYGGNATCSFLYSDIDEYYTQFAWTVVGNRHVQWKPSTASVDLPADARWLTADELGTIGRIDRSHLLSTLQNASSSALQFCLDDPEATSWRWLIRRTNFYATTLLPYSSPKPSYFGLLLPGSSQTDASYAVWMFDYIERKVAILRLRFTSPSTFKTLVAAVRAQAAEFGMQKCLAWNIDLPSLGVELSDEDEQRLKQGEAVDGYKDALTEGEVVERHGKSASLPALAWYADKAEGEKVEWVCNEYGWWC